MNGFLTIVDQAGIKHWFSLREITMREINKYSWPNETSMIIPHVEVEVTPVDLREFEYQMARLIQPMPCGHPRSAVVSSKEGTNYCGLCMQKVLEED